MKPTHATGLHAGTTVEPKRFGGSYYHCPCGTRYNDLKSIRKHVRQGYVKKMMNCPLGRAR